MVNKKAFVNPLTRSSEDELNIPKPVVDTPKSSTPLDNTQASPTPNQFEQVRKRGNRAFNQTHERFTGWIDKNLKQQLEKITKEKGVSKTSLINEAIADLLRKYMQK
jgi:hypothetical protein